MRNTGIESFQKEILFEATSEKELFDKEEELVEIGHHSYNLKPGGEGGWAYVNGSRLNNNKSSEQMTNAGKKSWKTRISRGDSDSRVKLSQISKRTHQSGNLAHVYFGMDTDRTEKARKNAWSEEAREKRNQTRQDQQFQIGKNNSQYGTMWITDGSTNRKIKRDDGIPEGWRKGRIISKRG